ncbi:MAG: M18 family aminopeptidase [Magnetococcales bacterium]|nr:M18 family aminopeptidase [Magnetococcales bacterium]
MLQELLNFLNRSLTPYHAVETSLDLLTRSGFVRLREEDDWSLRPEGRYVVVRGHSSFMAWIMPRQSPAPCPIHLAVAHTDSPCLKPKANALKIKRGWLVFDLQVYGGVILSSWFDRDLSLAGIVYLRHPEGGLRHALVDCRQPLTRIPNLAIHLNRSLNDAYKINPHEELSAPFLPGDPSEENASNAPLRHLLFHILAPAHPGLEEADLLDWDLNLYDVNPATQAGSDGQWLVGSRLDNLLSVWTIVKALQEHDPRSAEAIAMGGCFDHEEVGSQSAYGANGNFAESIVSRLFPQESSRSRAMARSWLLSLDNAHACHPNYPSLQDEQHCPRLDAGVVLKRHPGLRYATNALSAARIKDLAYTEGLPLQEFTVRADMSCGTTVGPVLSASLGIPGVDLGVPTWAMHSIRETAGKRDVLHLQKLLKGFFA